jgi:SAM-dependent methyltransferase
MKELNKDRRGFRIIKGRYYYPSADHPKNYVDCECEFAARHLRRVRPNNILDIGSYRQFIVGMLAGCNITTLDIRERKTDLPNERVITGDATSIDLPDGSFDAVVSLCSLEHFGLGAYGDRMDVEGDIRGFEEMKRVLANGGVLIFSTTLTRGVPSIFYNAHRVYTLAMVHSFFNGWELVEEKFYSHKKKDYSRLSEITDRPGEWDVYLACVRKPLSQARVCSRTM